MRKLTAANRYCIIFFEDPLTLLITVFVNGDGYHLPFWRSIAGFRVINRFYPNYFGVESNVVNHFKMSSIRFKIRFDFFCEKVK